jgi:hypothetical protein
MPSSRRNSRRTFNHQRSRLSSVNYRCIYIIYWQVGTTPGDTYRRGRRRQACSACAFKVMRSAKANGRSLCSCRRPTGRVSVRVVKLANFRYVNCAAVGVVVCLAACLLLYCDGRVGLVVVRGRVDVYLCGPRGRVRELLWERDPAFDAEDIGTESRAFKWIKHHTAPINPKSKGSAALGI